MTKDILTNIIAGLVCTGLAYIAKKLWTFFLTPIESTLKNKPYPKKLIQKQFLSNLFVLVFSLPAGSLLKPSTVLLTAIKGFLFLAAGYSFIFLWGAFDAAFEFYPADDPRDDKPPGQDADQT